MNHLRESAKDLPDELFKDMTALLKSYGVMGVKVVSFKMEPVSSVKMKCPPPPPGKRPFCRKYANGKVICRCV